MSNCGLAFRLAADHKARLINQGHNRERERLAELHKPARLMSPIPGHGTGQKFTVITPDTNRLPV